MSLANMIENGFLKGVPVKNLEIGNTTTSTNDDLNIINNEIKNVTSFNFSSNIKISDQTGNNIAIGNNSLGLITTGTQNVSIGHLSGDAITSAIQNTFVGHGAGSSVIATNENVAVGYLAGNLMTGADNTLVGSQSGFKITSGGSNTCVGRISGSEITTGSGNCVYGSNAGPGITTGSFNTLLGPGAGQNITTASNNVCVGNMAEVDSNVSNAISIGTSSYNDTSNSMTVGGTSIINFRPGNNNICDLGTSSNKFKDIYLNGRILFASDTIVKLGTGSMATTPLQNNSIAIGYNSLNLQTSGSHNVCVGHETGLNITSAFGSTFIGRCAGSGVTTGQQNTFIGDQCGCNMTNNITGMNNSGVGHYSLRNLTSGSSNIAIGAGSAQSITTGSDNICIGLNSNTGAAQSRAISIGYQCTNTVNNSCLIGDSSIVNIRPNNTATCDLGTSSNEFSDIYSVNAVTVSSDIRKKKEIQNNDLGLDFLMCLKTKKYKYKLGSSGRLHYGLIAQELNEVLNQWRIDTKNFSPLVIANDENKFMAIRYTELIPILIKAIQDINNKISNPITSDFELADDVNKNRLKFDAIMDRTTELSNKLSKLENEFHDNVTMDSLTDKIEKDTMKQNIEIMKEDIKKLRSENTKKKKILSQT